MNRLSSSGGPGVVSTGIGGAVGPCREPGIGDFSDLLAPSDESGIEMGGSFPRGCKRPWSDLIDSALRIVYG